jgi:hypothetical protein
MADPFDDFHAANPLRLGPPPAWACAYCHKQTTHQGLCDECRAIDLEYERRYQAVMEKQ